MHAAHHAAIKRTLEQVGDSYLDGRDTFRITAQLGVAYRLSRGKARSRAALQAEIEPR
jgi:hypothetical protein